MYKLQILLIINAVKNNIEHKSRQRWYYSKLPKQISEGFTLAEILITLLIVGILASLVIPALINDIQNQHYKVAYKQAFAVASQAWNMAINNNEIVPTTGGNTWYSAPTVFENFNTFKTYFKIIKDCPAGTVSNCWADGESFGGRPYSKDAEGFIDVSGRAWTLGNGTWNYIMVDTNGFSLPNKYGRDRFILSCKTADGSGNGFPVKLGVYYDFTSKDNVWCPSGGCYYRSWLSN